MECAICYYKIKWYNKKTLYCGHQFHRKCINKWLEKQNKCPFCRKIVKQSFVYSPKRKIYKNY